MEAKDKKRCTAIILAAGQGKRMGADVQKQYIELEGKPVIYYSLKAFQDSEIIDDIILVVGSEKEIHDCSKLVKEYHFTKVDAIVLGGKERYDSVWQALKVIQDGRLKVKNQDGYVFIHDGVRLFVDGDIIRRGYETVRKCKACVAGMPCKDTIKLVDEEDCTVQTPERKYVRAVQTPQVFETSLIIEAYSRLMREESISVTDDGMVVEQMLNVSVKLYEGSYENITNFHLFKHYVLVALERTQRKANYFLSQEENPFVFDEESSIYQEIQCWINEVMKATHAEKNAEIQGIIGNLSVYQSELISEHLLSSHNEAITATKTLFFSYMPFTISDEEFYQEIVPIIYQHRFITPFIDITLRIMDLEFFQERYPIVFDSCRQFLFALDCSTFEFSKLSLFFDLLLVLSRLYDQRNEKSTINLYVNFTQGEKYTQFIKEQIKIFESFSIHFHSAIRPDTDLVVSDYLPKTLFSVKCLIWLAPPRASDWQNFGNEIVRINKELQQTKQRKSE